MPSLYKTVSLLLLQHFFSLILAICKKINYCKIYYVKVPVFINSLTGAFMTLLKTRLTKNRIYVYKPHYIDVHMLSSSHLLILHTYGRQIT